MQSLPIELRRLVAVGLLAVAGLVVYALGVAPVLGHLAGLQDRLDAERSLLARYDRAVTAAGNSLASDGSGPASGEARSEYFLSGESASVVAARLQGLVREAGQRHKVSMNSLRDLPPRQLDDLVLIGLEASFEAPLAQLQRLLVDLEGAAPVLFLHELHISSQAAGRSAAERGKSEAPLAVRISVYAALPEPDKKG